MYISNGKEIKYVDPGTEIPSGFVRMNRSDVRTQVKRQGKRETAIRKAREMQKYGN